MNLRVSNRPITWVRWLMGSNYPSEIPSIPWLVLPIVVLWTLLATALHFGLLVLAYFFLALVIWITIRTLYWFVEWARSIPIGIVCAMLGIAALLGYRSFFLYLLDTFT